MRAIYLGADFVFAGRPFIYGVAALGRYGADHAAAILMDDLKNNMTQLGVANLKELRKADLAQAHKNPPDPPSISPHLP
jgi:L-lactate dehydrogenase (cytochrome)